MADSDDTIVAASDDEACVTPLLPGLAKLFGNQSLTGLQDDYRSPVFPVLSKKLTVMDRMHPKQTQSDDKEDDTQSEMSEVLVNLSQICKAHKSKETSPVPNDTSNTITTMVDVDDSDPTQIITFEDQNNARKTTNMNGNDSTIVHDEKGRVASMNIQKTMTDVGTIDDVKMEDSECDESQSILCVRGMGSKCFTNADSNVAGSKDFVNNQQKCVELNPIGSSQSTISDDLLLDKRLQPASSRNLADDNARTTTSKSIASKWVSNEQKCSEVNLIGSSQSTISDDLLLDKRPQPASSRNLADDNARTTTSKSIASKWVSNEQKRSEVNLIGSSQSTISDDLLLDKRPQPASSRKLADDNATTTTSRAITSNCVSNKRSEVNLIGSSQSTISDDLVLDKQQKFTTSSVTSRKKLDDSARSANSSAVSSGSKNEDMKTRPDSKSSSCSSSQSAQEEKHVAEVKVISQIESSLIIAEDLLQSEPDDATVVKVKEILSKIRPRINELYQSQAAERTWIGDRLKPGGKQTDELSTRTRNLHKRQTKVVTLFHQYRNVWDGVKKLDEKEKVKKNVSSDGSLSQASASSSVGSLRNSTEKTSTDDDADRLCRNVDQANNSGLKRHVQKSTTKRHCDPKPTNVTSKTSQPNATAVHSTKAVTSVLDAGPKEICREKPSATGLTSSVNKSTPLSQGQQLQGRAMVSSSVIGTAPVKVLSVLRPDQLDQLRQDQLKTGIPVQVRMPTGSNHTRSVGAPTTVSSVQWIGSQQGTVSPMPISVISAAPFKVVTSLGQGHFGNGATCSSQLPVSLNKPAIAKVTTVMGQGQVRKSVPGASQLPVTLTNTTSGKVQTVVLSEQSNKDLPTEASNSCIPCVDPKQMGPIQLKKCPQNISQPSATSNQPVSANVPKEIGSVQLGKCQPSSSITPQLMNQPANVTNVLTSVQPNIPQVLGGVTEPQVLASFTKPVKRAAPSISSECSSLDLYREPLPKRRSFVKLPIIKPIMPKPTDRARSYIPESAQSQVTYLPLIDMINANLIQPGDGVLSMVANNKTAYASLLATSGFIRSSGGEVFRTPTAWCAALMLIKTNSIRKHIAYKKVLYKGKSLADILSTSQASQPSSQFAPAIVTAHGARDMQDNYNRSTATKATNTDNSGSSHLSWMSTITHVHLISDADLCPSFLPHNFWTGDFATVTLPRGLIDSIESW